MDLLLKLTLLFNIKCLVLFKCTLLLLTHPANIVIKPTAFMWLQVFFNKQHATNYEPPAN